MSLEHRIDILPTSQHRPIRKMADPQPQVLCDGEFSPFRQHFQRRRTVKTAFPRTPLLISSMTFLTLAEQPFAVPRQHL